MSASVSVRCTNCDRGVQRVADGFSFTCGSCGGTGWAHGDAALTILSIQSEMENEVPTLREMPKYLCHKTVYALKIHAIDWHVNDDAHSDEGATITPDDTRYAPFNVDADFVQKHLSNPQTTAYVGGYYVVYDDGYVSYSPAAAFESGYTLDMTPHRRHIRCVVVRSAIVPDMLSLRVVGAERNAMELRRVLSANFEEGDEVEITLVAKERAGSE